MFGIDVYWYAILILFAIALGLFLCKKDDGKYNIKFDDILIISGNVPQYLSKTYIKILEILHKNNVQFIADVAGQTLLDTLPFRPLMVKPNIEELEDVFNIGIRDRKTLESFADKLIEMGAENVIISLGNDGAVMKTDKGEFYEQKNYSQRIETSGIRMYNKKCGLFCKAIISEGKIMKIIDIPKDVFMNLFLRMHLNFFFCSNVVGISLLFMNLYLSNNIAFISNN